MTTATELLGSPGKRVIVEGVSGTGKSTLASYLTYLWSCGETLSATRLLFLIDLGQVVSHPGMDPPSLEEIILTQCVSASLHKTPSQMLNLLKTYQAETLFILDGYDKYNGTLNDGIHDLLYKASYEKSSVLLLGTGPYYNNQLRKEFDNHYIVLGLEPGMEQELTRKYKKLTCTSIDLYNNLLLKLQADDKSILQSLSLQPLYCLFMCLICKMDEELNFTTLTELLVIMLQALQLNYHTPDKNNVISTKPALVKVVSIKHRQVKASQTVVKLSRYALSSIIKGDDLFPAKEVQLGSTINEEDFDTSPDGLGLVNPSYHGDWTCFHNSVVRDFMAAYALSKLSPYPLMQHLKFLLNNPKLGRVVKFYCGLIIDNGLPHEVYESMASANDDTQRTIMTQGPEDTEDEDTSCVNRKYTTKTTGRVRDYLISLECITECKGSEEVLRRMVSSLPEVLYVKSRDLLSPEGIRGLAYVSSYNDFNALRCLSLYLDHISCYKGQDYLVLADGIRRSQHLKELRFNWTNANLLAQMLAVIFDGNKSISSITCIDRGKASQKLDAEAWNDYQRACANMKQVVTFNFHRCRNTQAVACMLRHLPPTVKYVNLQSCLIDTVAAQELSKRLEHTSIHSLDLSNTLWHTMDFVTFCNGLRLSRNIKCLRLVALKLEGSFRALAETIKFNKSLVHLDLQYCTLSGEMFEALAEALIINDCLTSINLANTGISIQAELMLKRAKRHETKLLGLPKRKHKELQEAMQNQQPNIRLMKLPDIVIH